MMSEASLPATSLPIDKLETVRIRAGRSEGQYWKDLFSYREVLYVLAWRDVLVRYKQAAFGVAWAVIRPLITTLVFTLIFGRFGKFPADGAPYPLMVFVGLWPWHFFSGALLDASNSLVANQNLVSKVYFPRLLVPLASNAAATVDFLCSATILAGMMIWFGVVPTWRVIVLPLFFCVALATSAGCGFWLSALNVKYRDFRFIVPFLLQFGLYLSPVGFSAKVVPEKWMLLYSLNPMVGVIQGFRWALLGGESQIYWPGFGLALLLVAIIFAGGLTYFRRVERTLADVI